MKQGSNLVQFWAPSSSNMLPNIDLYAVTRYFEINVRVYTGNSHLAILPVGQHFRINYRFSQEPTSYDAAVRNSLLCDLPRQRHTLKKLKGCLILIPIALFTCR